MVDYSAFRDGERDGWSSRANNYGDATARATLQTIPKLLDHARIFPSAKVLNAGCGPGYVAASAKLLGADVEGIDYSAGMVERAKTQFPEIKFSIADVEDLPMRDGTFDAVLCNIVLFHVTDPKRAMSETRRVLKHSSLRNRLNHSIYAYDFESGTTRTIMMRIADRKDNIKMGQTNEIDLAALSEIEYAVTDMANLNQEVWKHITAFDYPT